jgi:hypothetical protein
MYTKVWLEYLKGRPLTRPSYKCGDNIKVYLMGIGMEGVGCIDLAQDRDWWQAIVNMVMNIRVPVKGREFPV